MIVSRLPYFSHRGKPRSAPFVLDASHRPVFLRTDGLPWKTQPRPSHPVLEAFGELDRQRRRLGFSWDEAVAALNGAPRLPVPLS